MKEGKLQLIIMINKALSSLEKKGHVEKELLSSIRPLRDLSLGVLY